MNIILRELNCKTKENILVEIAKIASDEIGITEEELLAGFKLRESQTSTGMIEGIAIPHTMQEIEDPYLIVCKSAPISDWVTLDGTCVEMEIAIIAPKSGEEHLKLLSQISRKLISSENIALLKEIDNVEDIKELLEL